MLWTLQVLLFTLLGWLEEVSPFMSASLSNLTSFVQVEGDLVVLGYFYLFCQAQIAVSLSQFYAGTCASIDHSISGS